MQPQKPCTLNILLDVTYVFHTAFFLCECIEKMLYQTHMLHQGEYYTHQRQKVTAGIKKHIRFKVQGFCGRMADLSYLVENI